MSYDLSNMKISKYRSKTFKMDHREREIFCKREGDQDMEGGEKERRKKGREKGIKIELRPVVYMYQLSTLCLVPGI